MKGKFRPEFVVIVLAALTGFIGCSQAEAEKPDPVAQGKYLVTLAGCHDCHTPKKMDPNLGPVPDMSRMLAGHPEGAPYPVWSPTDMQERHAIGLGSADLTAWAGPWGVSFAINLTPDKETGIGEWTEEAFIQAMRTGKHQGQPNGRAILPPMPWFNLAEATDEDLKYMWVFMRSIPAVKNKVPEPVPPAAPAP